MKLKPLEPGDVICGQCNGTGKPNNNEIDYQQRYVTYSWVCDKCNGLGKLDWIENVVGKTLTADWIIEYEQEYNCSFGNGVEKEIMDKISKQMVDKIDKEILEGITNGAKTGTWGSNM